jgi:hypothetical protein
MADAVAMFGEVWSQTTAHIIELIEGDDVVVAVVRIELRSQAGVDLEVERGLGLLAADGKLTRIEQHGDRHNAFEAAGLSE